MTFEWNPDKDIKNFHKHKLHLLSAITFFEDPNPDEEYDEQHSDQEPRHRGTFRWNDHYLFISYTMRGGYEDVEGIVRIISARPATKGVLITITTEKYKGA